MQEGQVVGIVVSCLLVGWIIYVVYVLVGVNKSTQALIPTEDNAEVKFGIGDDQDGDSSDAQGEA